MKSDEDIRESFKKIYEFIQDSHKIKVTEEKLAVYGELFENLEMLVKETQRKLFDIH
jgi:hypothetical protein